MWHSVYKRWFFLFLLTPCFQGLFYVNLPQLSKGPRFNELISDGFRMDLAKDYKWIRLIRISLPRIGKTLHFKEDAQQWCRIYDTLICIILVTNLFKNLLWQILTRYQHAFKHDDRNSVLSITANKYWLFSIGASELLLLNILS